MIAAPGADSFAVPFPNKLYANRTPIPGPGLVSSNNRTDWPFVRTCSDPIGDKIP